jgi:hypothetical protein
MNISTITSIISGVALGIGYGWFFLARMQTYFSLPSADEKSFFNQKSFLLLLSFFLSYGIAGACLYLLMQSLHIDMLISSTSFMIAFWFMVWRYTKKLL